MKLGTTYKLGTPSKLVTANRTKKALKVFYSAVTVVMMMALCTVVAFAEGGEGTAEAAWSDTIDFFTKWIKRAALAVALLGGVMFGFAIKNNDAEQKQSGLLTMVAGFVVAALCQGADMFGFTT